MGDFLFVLYFLLVSSYGFVVCSYGFVVCFSCPPSNPCTLISVLFVICIVTQLTCSAILTGTQKHRQVQEHSICIDRYRPKHLLAYMQIVLERQVIATFVLVVAVLVVRS